MTEIITINTKGVVPNHLSDTNIFCRYANNTIIEVSPKEIHFAGYKLNERNYQEIRFTNISDEISRFHIIPPVSKYFRLKYNKPERMVPGFFVKCTVIFTPDKARNYNDFIKIHTKDSKNNIIVPIYAYPVIKGLQVPRNMNFAVTPVGKRCQKQLLLHSDSDIDFDYEIVVVKPHPSITVLPLSGVIPARNDASIALVFQPTDYTTCETTMNIYVSQYNFKPIVCTVFGTSEPGLERKLLVDQSQEYQAEHSDLISLSKLESKRKVTKTNSNTERFEKASLSLEHKRSSKKQLQMEFESRLRENITNEKQNQLRWQTCRGTQPLTPADLEKIQEKREMLRKEYNTRIRRTEELSQCYQTSQIDNSDWIKTIRFDEDDKDFDYSIGTPQYVPDYWMIRKSVMDRFRSAAWRIIINNRLKARLKKLIDSGGNYEEIDNSHFHPGGENLTFFRHLNTIAEERLPEVKLVHNNDFDMTEYQLMLPIQPHYRYLDLQVPLQMQVLNYERVDTSSLSYHSLQSGCQMRSANMIETSIEVPSDPPVMFIQYAKEQGLYQGADRDSSQIPIPQPCSFLDEYAYFPLYNYKNNLLEENEPMKMDWKIERSPFIVCKKLISSTVKSQLTGTPLNSILIPPSAPKLMTKNDLDKLDYDSSSKCPVIDFNMIEEEFPILSALRENLENQWNT